MLVLCGVLVCVAYGQEDAGGDAVEGVVAEIDTGSATPMIVLVSKGAFLVSGVATERLLALVSSGDLHKGSKVVLKIDEVGDIKGIELLETPEADQEAQLPPEAAAAEKWALGLKAGDRVALTLRRGSAAYVFREYTRPDMLLLTESGGLAVVSIHDLVVYRTVGGPASVDEPETGNEVAAAGEKQAAADESEPAELFAVGAAMEIDGVRGFVARVTEQEVVLSSKGELVVLQRAEIKSAKRIPRFDLIRSKSVAGDSTVRVKVLESEGDARLNRWTVHGVVSHGREGTVLLGARLDVTAIGVELATVRETARFRAYYAKNGREDRDDYVLDGAAWHVVKQGTGMLVLRGSRVTRTVPIPLPGVLAGVDARWVWTSRLHQPEADYKPVYTDEDFVPLADSRAVAALIEMYEGGDVERRALLLAIVDSASPSYLPFLLSELLQSERGSEQQSLLFDAFAAFGEEGSSFVGKVLAGEVRSLEVPGRSVSEPERATLLKAGIALAAETGDPDVLMQVIELGNDPDLAVRGAALDAIESQGAIAYGVAAEAVVNGSYAAQNVFLALFGRDRDNLRLFYEELGGDGREVDNVDSRGFLKALVGLLLASESSGQARNALTALSGAAAVHCQKLQDVLKDVAVSLAKRWRDDATSAPTSVPEAQARQVEALRRSLVLDPASNEARKRLGEFALTIGEQVASGASLRSGPGAEYAALQALRQGEFFRAVPQPEHESAGSWLPVQRLPAGRGYLPRSCVHVLGDSDDVLVVRSHRPLEETDVYFQAAAAFQPELRERAFKLRAQLFAAHASSAAEEADWNSALRGYRIAGSLAGGGYLVSSARAYIHSNAALFGLACACFVGMLVSLGVWRSY